MPSHLYAQPCGPTLQLGMPGSPGRRVTASGTRDCPQLLQRHNARHWRLQLQAAAAGQVLQPRPRRRSASPSTEGAADASKERPRHSILCGIGGSLLPHVRRQRLVAERR